MKRVLVFIIVFIGYLFVSGENVLAYEDLCVGGELYSSSESYNVCNKQVYIDKDNRDNSSYIIGDRGFKPATGKVLYAGKIDGRDTFYSTGFHYYGIVFDDGPFSNKDMYSD